MKAVEFASLIHECTSEVLDTMYFATVLGSASLTEFCAVPDTDERIAFSVRFVGDISGRFGLRLDGATARTLAANFLGEAEEDIPCDDVGEVIEELANMLCGSVMSRVEGEHPFALSRPTAGCLAPSGTDDFLACALETDSGVVGVWILVEVNQCLC